MNLSSQLTYIKNITHKLRDKVKYAKKLALVNVLKNQDESDAIKLLDKLNAHDLSSFIFVNGEQQNNLFSFILEFGNKKLVNLTLKKGINPNNHVALMAFLNRKEEIQKENVEVAKLLIQFGLKVESLDFKIHYEKDDIYSFILSLMKQSISVKPQSTNIVSILSPSEKLTQDLPLNENYFNVLKLFIDNGLNSNSKAYYIVKALITHRNNDLIYQLSQMKTSDDNFLDNTYITLHRSAASPSQLNAALSRLDILKSKLESNILNTLIIEPINHQENKTKKLKV